jgi:ferric-dicitrate binding protein FerR (iron transport regulator)
MDDKILHSTHLNPKKEQEFSKGEIRWEKSQTEVWKELEGKIAEQPSGRSLPLFPTIAKWSAAAIVLVLVGLWGVVSVYTKTVDCLPGQHSVAELPDGSRVDLNAGSSLKYHPLKWKFTRTLQFEGEAYFNVQKGKTFTVKSNMGSTQVLGTSFNIFARDENYRVTCLTGKVKVNSIKNQSVILTPNVHVELEEGKLVLKKMFKVEKALAWRNQEFYFAGRPLLEVINEIERQYAITIKLDPEQNMRKFGSNFSKKHKVEDVLDFVCKTMNLTFVKQSENVYLVKLKES